MVSHIYIKEARVFQPKPPNAAPSTTSNAGPTATPAAPLEPEAEARLVYLNRARVVGHGTVFRGDVPQLLQTLPRTDADVHVYMTGPFTKPEKVLAVEPIKCRMGNVRKLWSYMTTYNKPLLEHVSADLDEAAMTALEESLVEIELDSESGGGVAGIDDELHQTDGTQPPSSSGLHAVSSSRVVSYIGTNLLVNDQSSNNDVDNDVEPVAADGPANEPSEDDMIPADLPANDDEISGDLAACDEHDDEHGGEGGHHTTDDAITEEIATLEAIAHRVRLKYCP
jgi:hypothetical protein